jgi:serine/threonine protein kinase
MTCLDENQFLRYQAGRLTSDEVAAIETHLDRCPICRRVFSALALVERTGDHLGSSSSANDGASAHLDETSTWAGQVLDGRYRLKAPLGTGGTGQVFLAEHLRTGRRCAVKLLSDAALADSEAVRRFSREARILGQLEHRGIVGIHDFSEADGRPYLVMDYLRGQDLAAHISEHGPFSWQEARPLFQQMASALATAHKNDVLHRDVKPSNIFLIVEDDSGQDAQRAVLLDFGLAKSYCLDDPPLTHTGEVMGTPAYMSPEQARGLQVDQRTDVYGLAGVLFQMLTGGPPYGGSSFTHVLSRVLTEAPPSVSEHARYPVPPHMDHVLTAALAKEPSDRFLTVTAFSDAVLADRSAEIRRTRSTLSTERSEVALAASLDSTTAPKTTKDRPTRLIMSVLIGGLIFSTGVAVFVVFLSFGVGKKKDIYAPASKIAADSPADADADADAVFNCVSPSTATATIPIDQRTAITVRQPRSLKRQPTRRPPVRRGPPLGTDAGADDSPFVVHWDLIEARWRSTLPNLPTQLRLETLVHLYQAGRHWKPCVEAALRASKTKYVHTMLIRCLSELGDRSQMLKWCHVYNKRYKSEASTGFCTWHLRSERAKGQIRAAISRQDWTACVQAARGVYETKWIVEKVVMCKRNLGHLEAAKAMCRRWRRTNKSHLSGCAGFDTP